MGKLKNNLVNLLTNNTVVSIDIGSNQITMIVGNANTKEIVNVKKVVVFPTPENSLVDGQILDADAIALAIRVQVMKHHLKNRRATFTLKSPLIIIREFVLPDIKGGDIATMLQFEIEQYLPIILNDYAIEHRIIERFSNETGPKQKVLICAMPSKIVEQYYNIAKNAMLSPHILDVHSNCIEKLFFIGSPVKDKYLKAVENIAFINIGHSSSQIHIMNNGVFRYERNMDFGSIDIKEMIMKLKRVSEQEAIEMQNALVALDYSEEDYIIDQELSSKVQEEVTNWAVIMQQNFSFFTSRTPGSKVDEIFLFGEVSKLKGLSVFLENYFKVPVTVITTMNNIKIKKNDKQHIPLILNVAGAIIRR